MEIREQLVVLAELRRVDIKLVEARSKLAALPKKAADAKERSEKFLVRQKNIEAKKAELLSKRRHLDGELTNERANLRKWEARAEKIRGEREYTALSSEINAQKRVISGIETQILDVMQGLEDSDKELKAAVESAEKASASANEEWELVSAEISEQERAAADFEQSRVNLSQKLRPDIANRYKRLAERRGGHGVALIVAEVCQACQRVAPAELFLKVSRAEVIEQCQMCQRIFVPDDISFAPRKAENQL